MKEKVNIPYAPNLIESMRSLGYSFETALADIVDNSIAANATKIDIVSIARDERSFLVVMDNGQGMSNEELFNAMKYGSKNPNESRNTSDMGRFGLGMKSASLSQCRKLTIVSKKNNAFSSYSWDLDYIIEKGEWVVKEYDFHEIKTIYAFDQLEKYQSGTIVLWENFDRISSSSRNMDDYLKRLLERSIDHFSLIYHRLLGKRLVITINGNVLIPRDPFLESNENTQLKREQSIRIGDGVIKIKPYILPHVNKLTQADIIKLGGKESLRTEQGFYIYRNKRLIIWGTWFRLNVKNELFKLARVKVDIPNSMDYLWDIDIKKSRAILPDKLKQNLYNAVITSCELSETVHTYKGRKQVSNEYQHLWNVIDKRGSLSLEVDLDNLEVRTFLECLDSRQKRAFLSIIDDIQAQVPIDYIYTTIAKGKTTEIKYTNNEKDERLKAIREKLNALEEVGMDRKEFIDYILNTKEIAEDQYLKERIEMMRDE